MQNRARLVWGQNCPSTDKRHVIELDDETGGGWCCQCAETFTYLEIRNEQLREALTWAVSFIVCNTNDKDVKDYPDYQNCAMLVSDEEGLWIGPFQLALSQLEELQRENERLTRWRRLLNKCPKGEARQAGLQRFAQVEALQPLLEPWKHQVAELKAENLLLRSKLSVLSKPENE